MLNIPESVKALFLRDGVRKNLRISSPSGAFADICNDRIVKESLKLRESVSSADSLAFGTAEGATLQFEAVGIPNLLGQDIVAALEVDASTLPPELQTIKPDIPYPVFAVPMGVYRVTACPRDKNAVPHRKVTAQQRGNDAADFLSRANRQIAQSGVYVLTPGKVKFRIDPFDYLLSNGFLTAADYAADVLTTTQTEEYTDQTYAEEIGCAFCTEDGKEAVFALDGPAFAPSRDHPAVGAAGRGLYSASCSLPVLPDTQLRAAAQAMAQDMFAHDICCMKDLSGNLAPVAVTDMTDALLRLFRRRWPLYGILWSVTSGSMLRMMDFYGIAESEIVSANVYPDKVVTSPASNSYYWEFCAPLSVRYTVGQYESPSVYNLRTPAEEASLSVTLYDTESMGYRPSFTFSAEIVEKEGGGFRHYWSAELLGSVLLSALELMGGFGQIARDGSKYIKYLEPANPYPIGKEVSESCWWDEYDLEPIGSIAYSFNGEDLLYSFGPGRSVYTITNQAILDRLTKYKQSQVEQFFEAQLVPRLASIRFTPMELVCRGLPFLEAGDCIAIEADDGAMVPTYVLERNFSGIQHLTDRVTADGITIVEVEA